MTNAGGPNTHMPCRDRLCRYSCRSGDIQRVALCDSVRYSPAPSQSATVFAVTWRCVVDVVVSAVHAAGVLSYRLLYKGL